MVVLSEKFSFACLDVIELQVIDYQVVNYMYAFVFPYHRFGRAKPYLLRRKTYGMATQKHTPSFERDAL